MKAKVYFHPEKSTRIISPAGRLTVFFNHKFVAIKQEDMDYLDACVANNNECGVYINPDEYEVDTEEMTEEGRKEKIRREAVEEYIKSAQAELKPQGKQVGGLVVGAAGSADTKGVSIAESIVNKAN